MPKDTGVRMEASDSMKHSAVCEEVCNEHKIWCERWSKGVHRTCDVYREWMTADGSETLRIGNDVPYIR